MSKRYRPTWAEIHQDHLIYNFDLAQSFVPHKTIIPVIKANAYGHGAIEVMKILYDHGIRICAVSLLEEALELRKVFKDITIIMLGAALKQDLAVISKYHIEMTIYDQEIIKDIAQFKKPLICHLKIDTGMSRYGLTDQSDIEEAIQMLQDNPNVHIKGIYTHFATSDKKDAHFERQVQTFKTLLSRLSLKPEVIHMSNSSSIFQSEHGFDFTTHVRLGISLYGLSLDDPKPLLKPVMSLKSKIIQVKHLKKGDKVGYGATYVAEDDMIIGICPIGYADGFIRRNKTGYVEIHQKKYKIIGIICMDALFIKIDAHVKKLDTVTLFGNMITIDDVAQRLNTINYEVVTNISNRVPRVIVKGESS